VLGAACAACRYRDVASHSSFESAGRELNSPSLTQQARNTWLWVVGRSQRRATIRKTFARRGDAESRTLGRGVNQVPVENWHFPS
jgi:hypothetical protein